MEKPYTFPATHRLHGSKSFEAVYDAKTRESRGPLLIYAKPNGTGHARLGLSVSRRVGNAVVRGRAKRLLREAFRFLQHDFPLGYDLVIVVRPHQPLLLAAYQELMMALVLKLHQTWDARRKRAAGSGVVT